MGYVAPTTRADGYVVPAATWNSDVVENIKYLKDAPTFDGAITVAAGQIVFPATQNASANANTLDDYEEGTWTPAVGGTATYTSQAGTYTKIGRLVFVRGALVINVIGTGSTTNITGLPFAAAAATAGSVGAFASAASSVVSIGGYISSSTFILTALTAGSTGHGAAAVFGNGTTLEFACTYQV